MKRLLPLYCLILLGILGCVDSQNKHSAFDINTALKTTLGIDGLAEFFYWEIDDNPNLWSLNIGKVEA